MSLHTCTALGEDTESETAYLTIGYGSGCHLTLNHLAQQAKSLAG